MSFYQLEKRFGVTAVKMGFITAAQLHEAMRIQLDEDLLDPKSKQDLRDILLKDLSKAERKAVIGYAVALARYSRPASSLAPSFVKEWVQWGAGPRAPQ